VQLNKYYTVEMGRACGTYGGEYKCVQRIGGEKLVERDHLEDLLVDGRKTINFILKASGRNSSGTKDGQTAGCCEDGNEPLGSRKCGGFAV
jgi:hypothetical protein